MPLVDEMVSDEEQRNCGEVTTGNDKNSGIRLSELSAGVSSEGDSVSKSPGSVGSSCSDDTVGDTRSLTEEEMDDCGDKMVDQSADKSEVSTNEVGDQLPPDGSAAASSSPVPSDNPSEIMKTDIKESNEIGNTDDKESSSDNTLEESKPSQEECDTAESPVRKAPPPKLYRLNASVHEHLDDEDATNKRQPAGNDHEVDETASQSADLERVPHDPYRGDEIPFESSSPDPYRNSCMTPPKCVRFSNVCIRDYSITIGDSPFCSNGVPICLDWDHGEEESMPIDFYESSHKRRRTARKMLLNSFQRRDMLWRSGYSLPEIEAAIKENEREKLRMTVTQYFLPIYQIQEFLYFGVEQCFGEKTDARQLEATVKKQQLLERQEKENTSDTEIGGLSLVQEPNQRPQRRLSFRANSGGSAASFQNNESVRSTGMSELSHDRDDPYAASFNSRFREYAVRVDRGQHDKATEIILCNLQRPHMRAFHCSWFSFFIAFFMWFAVTPLLKEIQRTLDLSKSDIWVSSLCGTAGTIIMRILIGPACDKFGARLCMAFMLAASAIPCALTGLVETARGLSICRTFVGIAGGSFVACQYWTSQMFTREVAGTANALVAGWGNLGGGVTQIIMGSVLFPLFQTIFSYEDTDDPADQTNKSELAWRTIFVVPAAVSLLTAYAIVYHADDSPKGDYRERVRQQEVMIVSPTASLCAAAQNWNVWILLIQYAACFGVEVTMTNATALYFQEEFGQTTVSAAAIASVFGFMNLFARGLGGFGSDLFNAKYGVRGRLFWQWLTLLVEGIAIVIFGHADTLGGSILALIFLSSMVQSAEGSTFGIVPYVDRRFTGSVVGWVGAGGNVGGACFSVLFINFDYLKAFTLMGVAASASSFLVCVMNWGALSRDAEMTGHEGKSDFVQHNEAIGITRDAAITFAQLDPHQKGDEGGVEQES